MAQIFPRSSNALARMSIVVIIFVVALLGWVVNQIARSPYATDQGIEREQPVPFSHQHHVGGLGIDCRYCHTSVETSNFAGIPPTSTCMNCHAQIWTNAQMLEPVRASYRTGKPLVWSRVHRLPDFVHFNHSIHVAKGVGCSTCHGRIDKMGLTYQASPLTMQWCLTCHRNPEKYVRPRDQVFNMAWEPPANQDELGAQLVQQNHINRLTACSTCHY